MFQLSDLIVFVHIVDVRGISGAARTLNMPKSSVSRALSRLEESVGTGLIERSTRHLRLTDAGHILIEHARRILDDVSEAENALDGFIGKPAGDLHVNVPFTFATGLLATMLPEFMRNYPQVRVVLKVENRLIDLPVEKADVTIRIGPLVDSELIARRLATFELWACASPAYLANQYKVGRPADLLQHTLISHADRSELWSFNSSEHGLEQIEVRAGTVIPEPQVLKTMLINHAGIGLLPDFHARDAIRNKTLVRLLPQCEGRKLEVHALYPSHRSLSAKVRVFIDALTTHLSSSAEPEP